MHLLLLHPYCSHIAPLFPPSMAALLFLYFSSTIPSAVIAHRSFLVGSLEQHLDLQKGQITCFLSPCYVSCTTFGSFLYLYSRPCSMQSHGRHPFLQVSRYDVHSGRDRWRSRDNCSHPLPLPYRFVADILCAW